MLEFHLEAAAELECVAGDYNAKSDGLGDRFRSDVECACAAIVQNPRLWRERRYSCRRVNLTRFPYYLIYLLRDDRLIVLAVAHAKRRPGYWINRLP